MTHTLRHDEALPRRKINDPIFKIDQKSPIEHEKEFINVVVFMPMILALYNGHPDHRIVHLANRLVVPFVSAGVGQLLHINHFKRSVKDVQVRFVRKGLRRFIWVHELSLNADSGERTHLACVA